MMFFELDEGNVTLHDIKRIVKGLLDNKAVFKQLTPEQYEDLAYIMTPTLAADQNEANIRSRWQKVLDTFEIKGEAGQPMRFYRDERLGRLYFGDEAGWQEAQAFEQRELDPSLLKKQHAL